MFFVSICDIDFFILFYMALLETNLGLLGSALHYIEDQYTRIRILKLLKLVNETRKVT